MKKIIAYVNTMRVHWLVEELRGIGVGEIMVTEYFKPLSQGSRFEFLCADNLIDSATAIVHRIGTLGSPEDTFVDVQDFDMSASDNIPLGQRVSVLQKGA
jgi:hypothetical protein